MQTSAELAKSLRSITRVATESGVGQNPENLKVIAEVLDTLAQSTASEQVYELSDV